MRKDSQQGEARIENPVRSADNPLPQSWIYGSITYAVVAALLALIMHEAVASIFHIATTSNTFGHIFLIPPTIAWLVWNRLPELKQLEPSPMPAAGILLLGTGFVWLLGKAADVQLAQQLAFATSLQVLVLAVFGRVGLKALALPTLLLIFLVPFGEEFVPKLQDITAYFVVAGLNLLDIPVYTDGVFLQTPSGDFEVAEACSGIRFMVSTLVLGIVFSVLCFKSWKRRLAVVALSVIIPIFTNGLRAFGIVYIAYLTDNKVAVGVDHLIYGWIFNAIVLVILILVGLSFSDRSVQDPPIDVDDIRPLQGAGEPGLGPFRQAGIIAASCLALSFALVTWIDSRRPTIALQDFTVPSPPVGWTMIEGGIADKWQPNYTGADKTSLVHYTDGGTIVSIYRAAYGYQRQGAELIGFGNTIAAPDDVWGWAKGGTRQITISDAQYAAQYAQIRSNYNFLRDAWQLYWVNGKFVSSPVRVKIETVIARLTGGPLYTATLVISSPLKNSGDNKGGEPAMTRFAKSLGSAEGLIQPPGSLTQAAAR